MPRFPRAHSQHCQAALRLLLTLAFSACRTSQPPTTRTLPSAVESQYSEELDETLRQSAIDEREGIIYRVGPGDSLLINVFRHPEFVQIPFTATPGIKPGVVVDNDGTIQFPLLGTIEVAGKTVNEIRSLIEAALARFIPEPHVTVSVLVNGSLRYSLLGVFTQPGLKVSDRPLNLLQAIALGGSIDLLHADLRGAYVARGGHKLPVNFYKLLRNGDLRQNIRLHSDDIIFVPDSSNEVVFVFGGGQSKGMTVPLVNGRLNLLQALAAGGMAYTDHSQGRFEKVRVLRGEGDGAHFYVVNAEKILRGEAAPFMLESGDLIFVPETGWTKWNQIINQFLPTLQLISGLLNPYVQLKYLGGF